MNKEAKQKERLGLRTEQALWNKNYRFKEWEVIKAPENLAKLSCSNI